MNCQTCNFWKLIDGKRNESGHHDSNGHPVGECHGACPTFAPGRGGPYRVWPVTLAIEVCKAWEHKPIASTASSAETTVVDVPAKKKGGRPPKTDEPPQTA